VTSGSKVPSGRSTMIMRDIHGMQYTRWPPGSGRGRSGSFGSMVSSPQTSPKRPRVFSGIQPSGALHLGNLLGANLRWVTEQDRSDAVFCVVDLHALTTPKAPGEIGQASLELATSLFAVGLDPDKCVFFVQSTVPQHAELAWVMQTVTAFGELSRMTQFKEKRGRAESGDGFISAGLFTYPALMAADILLYDTTEVPVGDDQGQHVELTRDAANRFNSRYGETFVIPQATLPLAGARVMDLQAPTNKMSKSTETEAGIINLSDSPAAITKKFKRAVTDSETEVRFDVAAKPGVSNLLSILGAATGQTPEAAAVGIERYGDLKAATAEAVVELLAPIQARVAELEADPGEVRRRLALGTERATAQATDVMDRVWDRLGTLRA
jgi:tryptophanyl-tRNA synthetase